MEQDRNENISDELMRLLHRAGAMSRRLRPRTDENHAEKEIRVNAIPGDMREKAEL